MTNNLTVTATEVKIDGKTVATLTDREAYTVLTDALYQLMKKDECVYLALATLDTNGEGVRTSRIATFLSMDRSNCTKALERLLEQGRIRVNGATEWSETEQGRPSRLWQVV